MAVLVGKPAPNFTAQGVTGSGEFEEVSLEALRGAIASHAPRQVVLKRELSFAGRGHRRICGRSRDRVALHHVRR